MLGAGHQGGFASLAAMFDTLESHVALQANMFDVLATIVPSPNHTVVIPQTTLTTRD
jgi:hypothetical protein